MPIIVCCQMLVNRHSGPKGGNCAKRRGQETFLPAPEHPPRQRRRHTIFSRVPSTLSTCSRGTRSEGRFSFARSTKCESSRRNQPLGGRLAPAFHLHGILHVKDSRIAVRAVAGQPTVAHQQPAFKIHAPPGRERQAGVEPCRLCAGGDSARKCVAEPVLLPAGRLRAAAAGILHAPGLAEYADHHIQVVNMQVKGQKAALFLLEQPASLYPAGRADRRSKQASRGLPYRSSSIT